MTTNRAWTYNHWHDQEECVTRCFYDGASGELWVCCDFHKVVAQINGVGQRITYAESVRAAIELMADIIESRSEGSDLDSS